MRPKLRIAIADDHTLFRAGTCQLLESFGDMEVVVEAANGIELLQQLHAMERLPDVCMLDVNMPGMNGFDTMLALKDQFPLIKVLAVSMHDSEFSMIKMLRNGAGGYLLKDADPEELHQALFHIHERDFYHSELVSSRLIRQVRDDRKDILAAVDLKESEVQFLRWLTTDLTIREIAERMSVKPRTLEKYAESFAARLDIHSRSGLVMFAVRTGIVPLSGNPETV